MSTRVNPAFIEDLKKFGAFDVNACFNCGNCTAICPLSSGNDSFPRRMIRYSQIGARDRLIASKEMWLCYYCGECSDTCPREAEPGEFMASARRYAIASFDPTGISRLLYTSKPFTAAFIAALSVLFALVLLIGENPMEHGSPALFTTENIIGFLSFRVIHDLGLGVIAVAVLAGVAGVVSMIRRLSRVLPRPNAQRQARLIRRLVRAARSVIAELAVEKRYRDCEEEPKAPWYRNRWFIHWAIMWGFIGLLVATTLDYLLIIVSDKIPGQPDPLWYPPRLLGTVAGLFLTYGTGLALVLRIKKPDKYWSHSLLSDWFFLWLLFLAGLTGFLVELAVYLPTGTTWGYVIFLIHVVLGMEVVVLLPFTKFAHAIYRPLALLIYEMAQPAED